MHEKKLLEKRCFKKKTFDKNVWNWFRENLNSSSVWIFFQRKNGKIVWKTNINRISIFLNLETVDKIQQQTQLILGFGN